MNINRIKSLICSNLNEDRQLAVELMRRLTEEEILYLLPDDYDGRGYWNIAAVNKAEYSQKNAYYYDLGFGQLGYNGFVWFTNKDNPQPLSTIESYKLKE